MLHFRLMLAFTPLIQTVSSTMKDSNFVALPKAADIVFSDHLLFHSPARSRLSCLELCTVTESCVRSTYTGTRGTTGTCRGHSSYLLLYDQGRNTPGARTYVYTEPTGQLCNVALHRPAVQSLTEWGATASKAVDGNPDTDSRRGSCSHTGLVAGESSWWQVDLAGGVSVFDVFSVIITNRGDCCGSRLRDFDVHVYTEDPAANPSAQGTLCTHYDGQMGDGETEELPCDNGPIRGRFVRVTNTPAEYLSLCEVKVMAMPV